MTGLEQILSQIDQEARVEAEEKLSAAREKAEGILAAAKAQAGQDAQGVLQEGEHRAREIRDRADSAAQLAHRNEMLSFKLQLIREAIDRAREQMESAPDDAYFSQLLALAGRHAAAGKAQMRLNEKDLARLPKDFETRLRQAAPQAEITVSKEPAQQLESGFLLSYEGIDVNCSFRALFEEAEGEMRDALSTILFPAQ